MDPRDAAGEVIGVADEAAGGFDGALYAANTAHHRAFDDAVLGDVPLRRGDRVLDLGCGAGDLTATVAGLVDAGPGGGSVLGVDASPSQVAYAVATHGRPGLGFVTGRAQDLDAVLTAAGDAAGWFDAALSVATLHWVPATDHAAVLSALARAMRPGGVLRAEFGGAGQIAALRAVVDPLALAAGGRASPWYFPDADGYGEVVTAAGFDVGRVALVRQVRAFSDAAAIEGYLCSQVLPGYLPWLEPSRRATFTANAVAACLEGLRRPDGRYDQDFIRLDLLAHRR